MTSSRFLFAVCQPGFERALKNEVAREHRGLRFAFSRPGFVTFRAEAPFEPGAEPKLECVFARTSGISLGKVNGRDERELAQAAAKVVAEHTWSQRSRHLHVWPRERPLPGDEGYDIALEEPGRIAGAALAAAIGTPDSVLNSAAPPGEPVLDCAIVEHDEWWIGWHRATTPETQWPGGVPLIRYPERFISRAYFKIVEALDWSLLPIAAGDRCVEIGSAPGGSCLALLERGLDVTGIDPAEMDPVVLAHPRFRHVRSRVKDAKRSVFRDCRWLVMDANVPPSYTLDTLDGLLARAGVRPEGLVLTLKLTDLALADQLPAVAERLRRHGYRRARFRQLAFNRREVCAVVTEPS